MGTRGCEASTPRANVAVQFDTRRAVEVDGGADGTASDEGATTRDSPGQQQDTSDEPAFAEQTGDRHELAVDDATRARKFILLNVRAAVRPPLEHAEAARFAVLDHQFE